MCLTHEAREALESTRNANVGVDFDENAFGGVHVDL